VSGDSAIELDRDELRKTVKRMSTAAKGTSIVEVCSHWTALRKKHSDLSLTAALSQFLRAHPERKTKPPQNRKRAAGKQTLQDRIGPVEDISCWAVFRLNHATTTRAYLKLLEGKGQIGRIGACLFRVQKRSSSAKVYRGDYVDFAYIDKGQWLECLCKMLQDDSCGLCWGWQRDEEQLLAKWVLYVDLPNGQVSFHSLSRFGGPDYPRDWDGTHLSEWRITDFCDSLIGNTKASKRREAARRNP